jgi:hypothetical protein
MLEVLVHSDLAVCKGDNDEIVPVELLRKLLRTLHLASNPLTIE